MNPKRNLYFFNLLLLVMILLFILLLSLGSVFIPITGMIKTLLGDTALNPVWKQIMLNFRLPKAITAVLAGMALSVSGLQMQTLFRNPLAGPYVLGISSGASLGVAFLALAGSLVSFPFAVNGPFSTVIAAVLGSSVVMVFVMSVAIKIRSSVTLLIVGIMFGFATGGLVSVLMHFSNPEDIQTFIYWTFGSFRSTGWHQIPLLSICVGIGVVYSVVLIKGLNALLLGEDYAASVGINVKRIRYHLLFSTAILAGSVTAFCGPIGFVGIAIPHLCRGLLRTSDHRVLIPGIVLLGGIVTMAAELIASLPFSRYALPLNAVTSVFGAPVVIWIVIKQQRARVEV